VADLKGANAVVTRSPGRAPRECSAVRSAHFIRILIQLRRINQNRRLSLCFRRDFSESRLPLCAHAALQVGIAP